MLYLSRKIGETVVINNDIEVTVVEVKGRTVKLGFNFPSDVSVLRKEVHQKVLEQNIAAAQAGGLADEDLDKLIDQKFDGNR